MSFLRRYSLLAWILAFSTLIFLYPRSYTYAYLDPGTGSLIIQVLIGGLLSSLFIVKLFWGRIMKRVRPAGGVPAEALNQTETHSNSDAS